MQSKSLTELECLSLEPSYRVGRGISCVLHHLRSVYLKMLWYSAWQCGHEIVRVTGTTRRARFPCALTALNSRLSVSRVLSKREANDYSTVADTE
jgi:hypothetical protein